MFEAILTALVLSSWKSFIQLTSRLAPSSVFLSKATGVGLFMQTFVAPGGGVVAELFNYYFCIFQYLEESRARFNNTLEAIPPFDLHMLHAQIDVSFLLVLGRRLKQCLYQNSLSF